MGDKLAQEAVCKRYPALYRAYLIWSMSYSVRCAIEAYITADVEVRHIASLTAQSKSVIEWYERLYYDVREQCKNPAFVALCLVPDGDSIDPSDKDGFWKLVAAFLGAQVVADLICRGTASDEGIAVMNKWVKNEILKRLMAYSSRVRIGGENFSDLAELAGLTKEMSEEDGAMTAKLWSKFAENLSVAVASTAEMLENPDVPHEQIVGNAVDVTSLVAKKVESRKVKTPQQKRIEQ